MRRRIASASSCEYLHSWRTDNLVCPSLATEDRQDCLSSTRTLKLVRMRMRRRTPVGLVIPHPPDEGSARRSRTLRGISPQHDHPETGAAQRRLDAVV